MQASWRDTLPRVRASQGCALCGSFLAFLFLVIACATPLAITGSGRSPTTGQTASFGLGPFIAGVAFEPYTADGVAVGTRPVYWSGLSSSAACGPLNPLFLRWGVVVGSCPQFTYQIPPLIITLQWCTALATVFAALAAVGTLCAWSLNAMILASFASFSATIFSIPSFALWPSYPFNANGTAFVPVFSSTNTPVLSLEFKPALGAAYGLVVTAFVFLMLSTANLCYITNRLYRRWLRRKNDAASGGEYNRVPA